MYPAPKSTLTKLKRNDRCIGFILSVFMLAIAGCSGRATDEGVTPEQVIPVALFPLEQGESSIVTTATGVFTTDDETLLSFKNGGIVDRIYVKEGDQIKKGQLLASLNRGEMNARQAQARAALEKAKRDYERAQQLYRDSVATREQMENAKTALDVVQQDWRTIQLNQGYSEIRATSDGFVLQKMANDGQVAGPGMPVLMVSGAGGRNWVVKAGVSDRQWAALNKGDAATIVSDAFSQPVPATVIRKSEMVDPASGTLLVFVRPDAAANLSIATGMFATVTFHRKSSAVWSVPYQSILDGAGETAFVFVTNDKETAKKVEVRIGALGKDSVSVLAGLDGHKYLIVSGSPYLKDGSRIKILQNNQ